MAEFFLNYGLFLAKALTVVVSIIVVLVVGIGLSRKEQPGGGLTVEKLNDKYREMARILRRAVLSKADWKKRDKQEKKERKQAEKGGDQEGARRRKIFVLDFKGDIKATAVASLREEINVVVSVAGPEDEVVLRLENYGGQVHEHGLAASQLMRLKDRGIPLTVIVDKVAASGGYLMASMADTIVAAPFAVIGSIGVLAQIPNFSRLMENQGVDFEQITAGKYKRTVTMFGKTTDEDRAKLREELEEIHGLFKQMVAEYRPALDIEAVSTGEHWYGTRALELGLVDVLGSSDDYLLRAADEADIFGIRYQGKQSLQQRLMAAMQAGTERAWLWLAQFQQERRFRGSL